MTRGVVSDSHPLHEVVLSRPKTAKPDRWLVAGGPVWATWPCACVLGKPCDTGNADVFKRCPCHGRTDVERFDQLPGFCCAARAYRLACKAASSSVQIGASA